MTLYIGEKCIPIATEEAGWFPVTGFDKTALQCRSVVWRGHKGKVPGSRTIFRPFTVNCMIASQLGRKIGWVAPWALAPCPLLWPRLASRNDDTASSLVKSCYRGSDSRTKRKTTKLRDEGPQARDGAEQDGGEADSPGLVIWHITWGHVHG